VCPRTVTISEAFLRSPIPLLPCLPPRHKDPFKIPPTHSKSCIPPSPLPSTPPPPPDTPIYSTVSTDSATLHFHHQGSGPLLILIPGAGAQSLQYASMLPHLASHLTTAAAWP
jgi:hypothetical protein